MLSTPNTKRTEAEREASYTREREAATVIEGIVIAHNKQLAALRQSEAAYRAGIDNLASIHGDLGEYWSDAVEVLRVRYRELHL